MSRKRKVWRRSAVLGESFAKMAKGMNELTRRRKRARGSHKRWTERGRLALMFGEAEPEINKADWGDGPWQHEPDLVRWTDAATGLQCLTRRNHAGAWCGYVAIPSNRAARRKWRRQGLRANRPSA